jgi:hypothetical protein
MADLHRDPERSPDGFDSLKLPGCFIAKSYRGERLTDGAHAVSVELNTFLRDASHPLTTTFHPLASRFQARSKEPAFAWGDEGAGSAQLAFVLLLDALQDVDLARRWFPEFHREVVSQWPDSWSTSEQEIRAFVEEQMK